MSAIAYVPDLPHPDPSQLPASSGEGSGGSGGASGNYGGSQPNFTPDTDEAWAIDTSTEAVWWYYSGAWHGG